MKIGILHQYDLSASGSCVYVRRAAESLLALGHEVHIVSKELYPQRYDFIEEALLYRQEAARLPFHLKQAVGGNAQPYTLFSRDGRNACVSHTLLSDIIAVACERTELPSGRLFTELSTEEIEHYINYHFERVVDIIDRYELDILHANHVLLWPYIAHLVKARLGLPYVVTVHGSTIEFVLDRDERYRPYVVTGLSQADRIIVLNKDVRRRVLSICPQVEHKLIEIPVGVETSVFQPIPFVERPQAIANLVEALANRQGTGKRELARRSTSRLLYEESNESEIARQMMAVRNSYEHGQPDADLGERLASIDWGTDRAIIYVGRLLFEKGVHCLIAAMPLILARFPRTRLFIVGDGVDREFLELLVSALDQGRLELVHRALWIARPYRYQVDGEITSYVGYLEGFLNIMEGREEGRGPARSEKLSLKAYMNMARGRISESVVFTGHLDQSDLAQLFPCADICVLPSIVKEAFPLVSVESLACGVVPAGAHFSGLVPILDEVAAQVGPIGDLVKLDHHPLQLINDLATNIPALLARLKDRELADRVSYMCRRIVEPAYSWKNVGARLEELYSSSLHTS